MADPKYMRRWRAANPDRNREIGKAHDQKRKGRKQKLTPRVLETRNRRRIQRLEAAAGRPKPERCEVCLEPGGVICWDHDHKTGQFRGWLCRRCNTLIGYAKDSTMLLRRLADYLEDVS